MIYELFVFDEDSRMLTKDKVVPEGFCENILYKPTAPVKRRVLFLIRTHKDLFLLVFWSFLKYLQLF